MNKNYRNQLVLLIAAALVLLPAVALCGWHGSEEAITAAEVHAARAECFSAERRKGTPISHATEWCVRFARVAR